MQHISIRKEHEIGTLLRTRDYRAYIVHPEGHAPRNTHQQMCHFLGKCTKILSFFCVYFVTARASIIQNLSLCSEYIYIYIYDTKKIHLVLMQFARDATIRVEKCANQTVVPYIWYARSEGSARGLTSGTNVGNVMSISHQRTKGTRADCEPHIRVEWGDFIIYI